MGETRVGKTCWQRRRRRESMRRDWVQRVRERFDMKSDDRSSGGKQQQHWAIKRLLRLNCRRPERKKETHDAQTGEKWFQRWSQDLLYVPRWLHSKMAKSWIVCGLNEIKLLRTDKIVFSISNPDLFFIVFVLSIKYRWLHTFIEVIMINLLPKISGVVSNHSIRSATTQWLSR